MAVRVFHRDDADVRLPMVAADARLVVWPGVGAYTANMNYVRMLPGEANVPHTHPESEDTIFVLSGAATVRDLTHDETHVVREGQVVHIPAGLRAPGGRRPRRAGRERRRPVPGRPGRPSQGRGAARRRGGVSREASDVYGLAVGGHVL